MGHSLMNALAAPLGDGPAGADDLRAVRRFAAARPRDQVDVALSQDLVDRFHARLPPRDATG